MNKTYTNINGDIRDTDVVNPLTNRIFRGAWQFSGDAIVVNMDIAREIQKEKIRAERKPLLEALDVEFWKAWESGDDTTEIIARKIILRGITDDARIEQASTPEELEEITIANLLDE